MNAVMKFAEVIRNSRLKNATIEVEGVINASQPVALWVDDALSEVCALRKILDAVSDARDLKTAKAIAATAADVPTVEDPRKAAERMRLERRETQMVMERQTNGQREESELKRRVESARRELARIDAERKREDELRRLIADHGGDEDHVEF